MEILYIILAFILGAVLAYFILKSSSVSRKSYEELQQNFIKKNADFSNAESKILEILEQLKEENRLLKRELELLIEKEKKEQESKSLEKENQSLKSKIEKTKNKENISSDASSEDKKPLKANKVTYTNTHEQEQ